MRTALVTGADRGLGLSITRRLAEQGYRVFAGSYLAEWPELPNLAAANSDRVSIVHLDVGSDESVEQARQQIAAKVDCIDLVINNAAVISPTKDTGIRGKQDYADLLRTFDVNAVGGLRVATAFLPLMASSEMKRLCFVSSEAGSIGRCERQAWYGYCMSKAALNMGVRHIFDTLRPEGYTFRLYHPGWMRTYMSGRRNEGAELEADEVASSAVPYFINPRPAVDEDRLVMRDYRGREWPW